MQLKTFEDFVARTRQLVGNGSPHLDGPVFMGILLAVWEELGQVQFMKEENRQLRTRIEELERSIAYRELRELEKEIK